MGHRVRIYSLGLFGISTLCTRFLRYVGLVIGHRTFRIPYLALRLSKCPHIEKRDNFGKCQKRLSKRFYCT
jgi:hypothetical protein